MPFQKQEIQDFIGKGLTFPINVVNGRAPLESGFELIRSSIRVILAWAYGNRYFLGEFGSKLDELLEEPNDQILYNLINTFVIDAIEEWEKRIELRDVVIENSTQTKIEVRLYYKIINTQKEDNFVFPFYRQIIY